MAKSRRGLTQDLLPHVREELGIRDLRVVYQPVISLRDFSVFAYEALLRSDGQRPMSPPELLSESILRNCCGELGRSVRTLAVEGCPQSALFLNVHPAELEDGWLVRPDDPIFSHEHEIFLEITEAVPMSREWHCRDTLREVRAKGIRLAIDDLGAGYSNLRYLVDLAPEVVKLDRELLQNLGSDPRRRALVRALVRMCEDLGARVVAEGIETAEDLDAIRECGAHFGQGYLIARPAFPPPLPFAASPRKP